MFLFFLGHKDLKLLLEELNTKDCNTRTRPPVCDIFPLYGRRGGGGEARGWVEEYMLRRKQLCF